MTSVRFIDLAPDEELAPELERAAARVIRSGAYVLGTEGERFEQDFARYCGVAGAVGVANGLEALQLTFEALGIGRGDEVIVPAHTSIATWLAVSHTGAVPVPVEPDWESMLIDAAGIEAAITSRSAAIVPVHLYGMPVEMEPVMEVAGNHGLAVVEDASQAHGARIGGRVVGSFGHAAAFSLYPTKNLGALGDGGVVVSDDRDLMQRVRMLANYGEREGRRHRSEVRGHNSRLDELQAALLSVKLSRLDEWNARRRVIAERYTERLAPTPELGLQRFTRGALPVWHQFVVRVPDRERVREELSRRGVQTLVHYPLAPHQAPAYSSDYRQPLPITERLAASVLSLPVFPGLSDEACDYVADALAGVMLAAG